MTALRLIIQNHPSWQRTLPENQVTGQVTDETTGNAKTSNTLPVESYKIYTVLGRRNMQWHTIVPRIENFVSAVDAMDGANRSTFFDRLVVAEAQSVANQPATRWETTCCALPAEMRQWETPSFESILERLQRETVQQDKPLPLMPKLEKQDATLFLLILMMTAIWSQTMAVVIGAMAICLFEMVYRMGWFDRVIPAWQARRIHTMRYYFYALCAGLIALPLATAEFMQIQLP